MTFALGIFLYATLDMTTGKRNAKCLQKNRYKVLKNSRISENGDFGLKDKITVPVYLSLNCKSTSPSSPGDVEKGLIHIAACGVPNRGHK